MNNARKLYIRDSLFQTAMMFSAGAALTQTYMAAIGLSDKMIGTAVSMTGIVNMAVSLLLSKLSDKTADIKKSLSGLILVSSLTFPVFAVFSFHPKAGAGAVFAIILAAGVVQSSAVAARNLFEYKLPFLIFDMDKYARILTLDGVIAGVTGVIFSVLLNILLRKTDYFAVMRAGFFAAFLMAGFTAYANWKFEVKMPAGPEPGKRGGVKITALVKRRDFYILAAPNFLRGVAAGVVSMAALIALNAKILDSRSAAYIVTATTAGNITGSILYSVSAKRVQNKTMCLVGTLIMTPMLLMPVAGKTGYVALFFFANLGVWVTSYSYPLMVFKLIPYEIIGTYNTLRLILTTAGTAAATYLTGRLLGSVPLWTLFTTAFLCQALSAGAYLYYYPRLMAEKKVVSD